MRRQLFSLALLLCACRDDGGGANAKDTSSPTTGTTDTDTDEHIPPDPDEDRDGFPRSEDCDDTDPARFPAANETCNGIDDDCDGAIDEDARDARDYYADLDADGWGDPDAVVRTCYLPEGAVDAPGDCDDTNPDANPEATEVCDGVDNDCNGTVDGPDATDITDWFLDEDSDGYGDPSTVVTQCDAPDRHVADGTDCDDTNADVNPGASEVCDGTDNNCDGLVDEATAVDAPTWYTDADSDGYGDATTAASACAQPSGTVADNTDCDDTDSAEFPGADELCDGDDDDCDGVIDEDSAVDAPTWYTDADSDGYGDPTTAASACAQPSGTVADNTDCDDTDAAEFPGADELCDGDDDDCDGVIDEDSAVDATTWYTDADSDGYGDPTTAATACAQPSGTVADNTDCDDTDAAEFPGADELCDGDDDDCDGVVDEDSAVDALTWYTDADADGYGDSALTSTACTQPSGAAELSGDCDDSDGDVYPGAPERCWTTTDSDCDGDTGLADDDCAPDGTFTTADVDRTVAGTSSSAELATALATGDVNGDGLDDLLVTSTRVGSGQAWVLLGATSISTVPWSLATAAQTLSAGTAHDAFGTHAAVADVSGDGLADIILGDPTFDVASNEGVVEVFFGSAALSTSRTGGSADVSVSTTEPSAQLGPTAGGDLDGDGIAELIVAAPRADRRDGLQADVGRVGIFLGPVSGALDLDDADRLLWGDHPQDQAGTALAVVPDTAGDGTSDLVVTAPDRDFDHEDDGAVYLLTDPTAGGDSRLYPTATVIRGDNNGLGTSIAGGDLNADGYGDLIFGLPGDDTTSTNAGGVLVFMGPLGDGTRLDESDADYVILGEARNDEAGSAVAATDMDADGYDDLVVGAPGHDQGGTGAGAVYALRGPLTGTASVSLSAADWEQEGAAGESLGSGLATGDLDGDSHGDVLATAPDASSGSLSRSGEVVLVLGGGRVETPTTPAVPSDSDDADADGYTELDGDCDDTRATVYPGAAETCADGRDQDCDGIDPGCTFAAAEDVDTAFFSIHGQRSNRTGTTALGRIDLNADGHTDLVLGSPGDDEVGVWFGPLPEGPTRTGSPDLRITGGAGTGEALARAGDFDGDGIDDLLIGAPDASDTFTGGGAVYVLLGHEDLEGELSFPTDADLVFTPEAAGDGLGIALAGGTDLDGDGVDDIILGADAGSGRVSGEGAVYVVYGGRATGTWDASTAEHILGGESFSDGFGTTVSFAGDVDGDGEQDVLIGAPDLIEERGGAYLVFGPLAAGFTDIATERARFVGGTYAATTAAGIGDVNADGYDDFAISVPAFTGSSTAPTGTVHVYFGPVAPAHHDLDEAPLVIEGSGSGDMMGLALAHHSGGSTDVDNDGHDDLLIGAPYASDFSSDGGAGWLFYGPLTAGTLDTTQADVALEGYFGGQTGTGIDIAGDLDGDGFTDLVAGAPTDRYSTWSWVAYSYAGGAYVWRGGDRGVSTTSPDVVDLTDDADGDGYSEAGGDCDDTRAAVYPGATEICENDLDDDCDGLDLWCLPSGYTAIATSDVAFQSATNYDHGTATLLTDVDGDGYDDLVVTEPRDRTGATSGGRVYWMFGPLQRGEADFLTSRSPDRVLYGSTRDDYVGQDAWVVSDLDGDGIDELLVGADGVGTAGVAYLITGTTSVGGFDDITTVATTTLEGVGSGDSFGTRVSSGDLDGDGVADLVVAAPDTDTGDTNAGTAYVFFGPVSSGTLSASTAHASIDADTYLAGLTAIEVLPDTDGDGLDDLLLGAEGHEGAYSSYGTGAAWLFTGSVSGTLSVTDATVTFDAEAAGDRAGSDVAGAGDVDGDGLADFLIGSSFTSAGGVSRSGIAYFFYGGVLSGTVDLGAADTRFIGTSSTGYVGDGLGTAGDVDNDGYDDILIGAPRDDELHLFRAPLPSGDISLTAADATFWPWGDGYGGQVGHPGDHDGDGFDDIVIAAPDSLGRVWLKPGGID